ncbi:D-2-hydroxyacid dehydrogenase [Lactobacillus sp. DCY120]|uniref:D-2-hydroxyacid dehydrogenase n=1 Tax=Bombilactobacillus apium TaxID=2675299 RepID=A0A850QX54_9LACO|nr:D-2-hydroxyacid dehydrogenase [Bombilactobacillus apium]NVY96394.1 D-2-hydroxyacid dehydrogenase [Bombilactobacillus apium]
MKKIILTSVRDDEMPAIKAWGQRNPEYQIATVAEELNPQNVAQIAANCDALNIQQNEPVDAEIFPQLKAAGIMTMSSRTAGVDNIALKAAKDNGVVITNVPAYSPHSVAEMAVTQTFRLIRQLELVDKRMAAHDFRYIGLQAREIHNLTIGIIGAGRIGGLAASLFHALGATVIAYDTKPNPELEDILTFKSLSEVLQESDVISLHVDLNPTSINLLDAQALSQMKPTAYLVNASRGAVVDTQALIDALDQKKIAGAAIDTLPQETDFFAHDMRNQPINDPQFQHLLDLDNVILTPHMAFYTDTAVENMIDISLDDIKALMEGKTSQHIVNP